MRSILIRLIAGVLVLGGLALAAPSTASSESASTSSTSIWFVERPFALRTGEPLMNASRTRMTHFDADAAVASILEDQPSLVVELFDGRQLAFEVEEVELSRPLNYAGPEPHIDVVARHDLNGGGYISAIFAFVPDGNDGYYMAGSFDDPDHATISVNHVFDDVYRLDEHAVEERHHDHIDDAIPVPVLEDESPHIAFQAPAISQSHHGTHDIEIIVGYSNGHPSNIEAQIRLQVSQTNQALSNSQVNARLHLIDVRHVNYQQSSNMVNDLEALQAGVGTLGQLRNRREQLAVDLAALIVPNSTNACGVAYVPLRAEQNGSPNYGFSVTASQCFGPYTFAHEIGHNLGANHNPEELSVIGNPRPYSYSHGKTVEGTVRDLMSYQCLISNCPPALQYSNPNVPFIGHPAHISGDATLRDNARSMNNLAPVVSRYRNLVIPDVHVNHQFYDHIVWMLRQGITTGYANGTFRPARSTERQAMAAFLYRFAGSPAFTPPADSPFSDVPTNHRFYREITWLRSTGITTGYSDGTFRPRRSIERQAMAAFLYRFAGRPGFAPPTISPFSDIAIGDQFYREVTWLRSTGITTGYADNTFRPKNAIQRQAIAAFLYRYE